MLGKVISESAPSIDEIMLNGDSDIRVRVPIIAV